MRIKTYALLCIIGMLLAACSHIGDDERFIKVTDASADNKQPDTTPDEQPTTTVKNVLLEDFTGQKCVYCPKGIAVIEQLEGVYGDRLVAVAIHGGDLGFAGNAKMVGLATDLGDTYYDYWKLEYQPVGLVDRGTPTDLDGWAKAVSDEMTKQSETKMEAMATLSGNTVNITVKEERLGNSYTGKLQVWLLEDGITALQMMPDGSSNPDFVHNHVLRASVNGVWGEDVTLNKGETKTQTLTQNVDEDWKAENLSVVAFLYSGKNVEQVVKAKVAK